MNTWLADFFERNDKSRYPVALRTRGGIGFKVGNETQSFFVGHPVHYYEGREWKPITLEHINGQFVGSDFSWQDGIYHKGKPLAKPESVTLDGRVYPLSFARDGLEYKCDLPFGQYVVRFNERGVKTEFVLYDDIDENLITFKAKKYKHELIETCSNRLNQPDGTPSKLLDPGTDYGADTADGYVRGQDAVFATARSTAYAHDSSQQFLSIGCSLAGIYYVDRPYLKFLTSGIPDGDTITAVATKMVFYFDGSTYDFDIKIVKANWGAWEPVDAAGRNTVFGLGLSSDLDDNIWRNTSGISTTTVYTSGALSTAWPSKTASTYYMLIHGGDRNNDTPIGSSYGYIAGQEHTTAGYRPVLAVTHAAAAGNPNFFVLF